MAAGLLRGGEIKPLPARQITAETCAKFGYLTGTSEQGATVQIAPYYDAAGEMVAQKLRGKDKTFTVRGDIKLALPFGAQAWPKTGRKIVVTEGELDALSVSQAQGNKWPVVSISGGADAPSDHLGNPLTANKTKKYFATHADYFKGFEEVVLMFDQDGPGRHSASAAAEVLGSRARIAEFELKDANAMLMAGRAGDIITAIWRAKVYRPEGVVEMSTLREQVFVAPAMGLSSPWPGWDAITYGIHRQEVVLLVAGTGVGKSDVTMQIATHLVTEHAEKVGIFALEGSVVHTAKLMAGKYARKRFHIPPDVAGWTQPELATAFDAVASGGKVFLYDSFGANNWPSIKSKIEFLVHTEGVRYFVLDHLTALVAGEEDARLALDVMMEDMAKLVVTLDITIFLVSHLNRPLGKSHEEGGRVTLAHIRNSGSVAMWSMVVMALERDQQAENILERYTTVFRDLKMRRDGTKVGQTFSVRYDPITGMLNELTSDLAYSSAGSSGFGDETSPATTHERPDF